MNSINTAVNEFLRLAEKETDTTFKKELINRVLEWQPKNQEALKMLETSRQ